MHTNLTETFGNIDIYLFDQLMKGRFDSCKHIIDVGCGSGRNIVHFLKTGHHVYGVDMDANAIKEVQLLSGRLAPHNHVNNFVVGKAEAIPFETAFFDLAICSAVLHFAHDKHHFEAMLHSVWQAIKPGGYLFARLAADTGIEKIVQHIGNGKYLLPDGTVRYLVNEAMLINYTKQLKGHLFEPIKMTIVNNQRCMATWCLQKR